MNGDDDLASSLKSLATLLENCGETFWSIKIQSALRAHKEGRGSLQHTTKSWFGGMGSLNDLIISRYNGHSVSEADESTINDRVATMRVKIANLVG